MDCKRNCRDVDGQVLEERRSANRLIHAHSLSQLCSFLEELKLGTKKYRSIASLSAQLAEAYRGRCVLELLQNAHDAMIEVPKDDPGLVSFVLKTEPFPLLFVANSGQSFNIQDFKGLCQLGQSPKDPNISVGNKGLGFRSVLEVASAPEIWSSSTMVGAPAFVFRFHPDVREIVAHTMSELDERGLDTCSPFDTSQRLVDWTASQLQTYRDRLVAEGLDASDEARSYLSPYDIPLTIDSSRGEVDELLSDGHVSVVCLPLDGGQTGDRPDALNSVQTQLNNLLEFSTTLFLPHLKTLVVEIDGDRSEVQRSVREDYAFGEVERSRYQRVFISHKLSKTNEIETGSFRVWRRTLGGEEDPTWATRICDAVDHLPNNWPKVDSIELATAVQENEYGTDGRFVTFLPTEKKTGSGAHVNAPFFGSLDRRDIDFDDRYNHMLLQCLVDLSLDAVQALQLESPNESSGRAIVDILTSHNEFGKTGESMLSMLCDRAARRGSPLNEAPLILCDDGWTCASNARMMPQVSEDSIISESEWRQAMTFSVMSGSLSGRMAEVKSLVDSLGGSVQPSHLEWITTVEQMASLIKSGDICASWDEFFTSLLEVLPLELTRDRVRGANDEFTSAKILPVQDGRLISADNEVRVFFQPVRGVDDIAELVDTVPASLEKRIAFIHSNVRTHEEEQSRRSTPVHKFLDGRFVRGFRREDILREVVKPAWPKMPVSFKSAEANLCAELLNWTITLLGKNPSDELINVIKSLPLACYGGWRSAQEASFGPGWSRKTGENLWELCRELPLNIAKQLRETLLLKPSDSRWGLEVREYDNLLDRIGVAEGIRLNRIDNMWFEMSSWKYELPETSTEYVDVESWAKWRTTVKHEIQLKFVKNSPYTLEHLYFLTEIQHFTELSASGQRVFSSLVLDSIRGWPEGWETVLIRRQVQGGEWTQSVTSPLKYLLSTIPWFLNGPQDSQLLCDRWYVPTSHLRGQNERFRHLRPLSLDLSLRLEQDDQLLRTLEQLGLNIYPTDGVQIGPNLLDALALACQEGRVQPALFDVFLGQLRHAWRNLDEQEGLPTAFVIQTARRRFDVLAKEDLHEIFLPDDSEKSRALREQRKPLLEMNIQDARRLSDVLVNTTSIRLGSELEELELIDEMVWQGDSDIACRLDETCYHWLPTPLLAIHAYGGPNPTGHATKTWREVFDRLRNARVLVCQSIKVALVEGEDTIAMSEPPARWLKGNVLAVTSEVKDSYVQLTEATESLLDRQDLRKDLNLVFEVLSGKGIPSRMNIEEALKLAEIDESTYEDIQHLWNGSVGWIVERIRPVVVLLHRDRERFETEVENMDRLRDWLIDNVPMWETDELMSAARKSRDDHEMGFETWRVIGDKAELPFWNAALDSLDGGYEPVENKEATEQIACHLEEARPLLSMLARKFALDSGNPEVFTKIEVANQNFTTPDNWTKQWWRVPFKAIFTALHGTYQEFVDARHLKSYEQVTSIEDLHNVLEEQGAEIDQDPYEIYRCNESQLREVLSDAFDLYRVWAELNALEQESNGHPLMLELGNEAYLTEWSAAELWRRAISKIADERFTVVCSGHFDVAEIRNVLGLDEETLRVLKQKREEKERETARQKHTVEIAGETIEIGLIDYEKIFREHTTKLVQPKGPRASEDEFTQLGNVRDPNTRSLGNKQSNEKIRMPRVSAVDAEVIGTIGEMHAYRFLRKEFGGRSVRPAAWVSETRYKVIPLVDGESDEINDGHGFDFRFGHRGIRWYIEVKATKGDNLSFDLGISEIKAATRIARQSSDNHRWRILRVRNALSEEPQIDWLPNPFEKGFEKKFRLHRGGMVVSYSRLR